MSEFAFNGSAGIYSSLAQGQAGALSTAPQTGVVAAAAVEFRQNEDEVVAGAGGQIPGDRQIELLLWLSNLSLRLPPYGDLN